MNLFSKIRLSLSVILMFFLTSVSTFAEPMTGGPEQSLPILKFYFGSFGSFEINQTWFLFGAILFMALAFLMGWFSYDKWLDQLDRKVTIAQRDIINIFKNIDDDLDELLKNYISGNPDKTHISQMKSLLKNIKVNLDKSRPYIIENIRELEK